MAKVIFSITDAQATALRLVRDQPDSAYRIDERCKTSLRQRGLIEQGKGDNWRDYKLTPDGRAVLSLVERLAILPGASKG